MIFKRLKKITALVIITVFTMTNITQASLAPSGAFSRNRASGSSAAAGGGASGISVVSPNTGNTPDIPLYVPGQLIISYKEVNPQGESVRGNALLTEHSLIAEKINTELNDAVAEYEPIAKVFVEKIVQENKTEKQIFQDVAIERAMRRGEPLASAMSKFAQTTQGDFQFSKMLNIKLSDSNADVLAAVQEINDTIVSANGKNYKITAEPNYIYQANFTPNDSMYSQQWAHPKTNAPTAWDDEQGNADIRIAIIDTGVLTTHPDLQDNIYAPTGQLLDFVNMNPNYVVTYQIPNTQPPQYYTYTYSPDPNVTEEIGRAHV